MKKYKDRQPGAQDPETKIAETEEPMDKQGVPVSGTVTEKNSS